MFTVPLCPDCKELDCKCPDEESNELTKREKVALELLKAFGHLSFRECFMHADRFLNFSSKQTEDDLKESEQQIYEKTLKFSGIKEINNEEAVKKFSIDDIRQAYQKAFKCLTKVNLPDENNLGTNIEIIMIENLLNE